MVLLNFGSLNSNGCRGGHKRAQLFEFLRQLWADVVLLQKTHSDPDNEGNWLKDWKSETFLSHGSNVTAEVAALFSQDTGAQIRSVRETMQGRLLQVDTQIGTIFLNLFSVYDPILG